MKVNLFPVGYILGFSTCGAAWAYTDGVWWSFWLSVAMWFYCACLIIYDTRSRSET